MYPQYSQSPVQPGPSSKKKLIVTVILGAVLLIVAAAVSFGVALVTAQSARQQTVKNELIRQNTSLKAAIKDGELTGSAIESVKNSDKVGVQVTPGSDLKTYCIEAWLLTKSEVAYHMYQDTTDSDVKQGRCGDNATNAPTAPEGLSIGSQGVGSVSLLWSPVTAAGSYTVECRVEGSSSAETKTVSGPQATIEGLSGGVQYGCRVLAENSKGKSDWSSPVQVKVESALPIPKNLKLITQSSGSLGYSWEAVPGAERYILEFATDESFMQNVQRVSTSATSGTIDNLKAYTGYYFHVKVITSSVSEAQAPFSAPVQGRTAK